MPVFLVHIALALAFVESVGLALLLLRVRNVPGLGLLIVFLLGVAVWVLSAELPAWLGPAARGFSAHLVALAALTAAVFVHFVLVLCGVARRRPAVIAAYTVAGVSTLAALVWVPGRYESWHGFESFFMPNAVGWVVGMVWALLAVAGHLVLSWHWLHRRGPPRGQLVAMCMASGWGLGCMSSYGFPALGLDLYPATLLFLPLYPLILVYGILRYRLMIVNAWARRALAWALVVGLGSALVIGLAALPLPFNQPVSGWRLWIVAVATLLAAGLLLDPFRRLATRWVYPGSQLGEDSLERWHELLSPAQDYGELAQIAARQLSGQLQLPILVRIDGAQPVSPDVMDATPTLVCHKRGQRWATELAGWDAAPPGPRYVAQLFGTSLAAAAAQLEQARALAQRITEQQRQERLAELGALAATVAHDIRNPLNIIGMAAAGAPPGVRSEIATQAARISQLATDLLDYAKSWQVEPGAMDLSDLVHNLLVRYPQAVVGPGLNNPFPIVADPRRLTQALLNVLENAQAAVQANGGRVEVDAGRRSPGTIDIRISDSGAGVPAEIRHTLFQPFVSRRPDGTGLGLAIVAKIMQAHGGSARLEERPGWATCFVLTLPQDQA